MEGRIGKEVAEKIRKAAVSMKYQPNQLAKSLKINKTNTIGLIVADISNPFSSSLARIIEDEAYKHGYIVLFGSSDEKEDKCALLIDTFINRQVDGLVILAPENSGKLIRSLHTRKMPFVLVDRYFPEIPGNSVCLDNYEAAKAVVHSLISQGRKRIGMIAYDTSLHHLRDRQRGYEAALADAGIKASTKWIKPIKVDREEQDVPLAIASLMELNPSVDALLFVSNKTAVTGLRYLNKLPSQIISQLSLASFDHTEVFDFFRGPVAYVQQPLQEMGVAAVDLLLKNIHSPAKGNRVFMKGHLASSQ